MFKVKHVETGNTLYTGNTFEECVNYIKKNIPSECYFDVDIYDNLGCCNDTLGNYIR